ncbi:hypothetical protein [Bradyrhizobium sp. JYMT SZCCT0428]|uniref:hypothetical protein n=1 Tax=Bradyrhizobium sp. JYMT SZCCT0428 TaxID=2807673 RepID=UPI002011AE02|nr:hypothetical protein [Bradyrhizobium sp. JYMT SZCCT0428]
MKLDNAAGPIRDVQINRLSLRALDLPVIAEGVETASHLVFLAKEGCAEIQGHLIGRPQPIAHCNDVAEGLGSARRLS